MCGNNINDLTGIHILKGIKILVFKENNISKFDYFDGLPNLVFLDLSFNKIRSLEKGNIGFLPSLKTLILDNNYLKNVNSLAKISSLNFLSIDNNKIQEISLVEKLAEHENLRELNLNNNLITKNYNYRQSMIRKFLLLTKLDNYV
jgi:protein phosphatase 1 regulatory subunit 7